MPEDTALPARVCVGGEDGLGKCTGVEGLEVLNSLANAHEGDWNTELAVNGNHDAAAGDAVQFGEHQSAHRHRL